MFFLVTAVLVVLTVSFLCSIFEAVLLSVRRSRIELMRRNGEKAGELLAGFKTNMDVPIAAILILNTAAHTIGASVAGASYAVVFDANTLWLFSVVFTLAVLLFTEIIPKTLGVNYAGVLAAPVAHGIYWLTVLLKPLVVISERISRSLRSDTAAPITSSEEIRLLAFLGGNEGAVGRRTADMIVGATQLRHLRAADVMLPRDEIQFLSTTMSRRETIDYLRASGHSRFPLSTSEDLDEANAVVFAKEVLIWLLDHDDDEIDWATLAHEPLFIPDSSPLQQLLTTFQSTQRHLAIVVDEYGSVQGIATLEDVIEEIVGDIRDEHDLPADDVSEQPDGSLVVRGTVDLRVLSARLGVPWNPRVEVTTIGGLVTETLERIPKTGDVIRWSGYRVEVLRADRHRAQLLAVRQA